MEEDGFVYIFADAKIEELSPSSWRQARLHRSLAFYFRIRPNAEKVRCESIGLFLVGEDGFEPSKRNAADLQSVPFGHSGTPPYSICSGAGRRTRTPDLLITNQLLYQLSYTGGSTEHGYYTMMGEKVKHFFHFFRKFLPVYVLLLFVFGKHGNITEKEGSSWRNLTMNFSTGPV